MKRKFPRAKWRRHRCQQRGCKQRTYLDKPFCRPHYEERLHRAEIGLPPTPRKTKWDDVPNTEF